MRHLLSLVLCIAALGLKAQSTGKILVLCNVPGQVLVDGQAIGDAEPNKPLIHEVGAGDHLVQVAYTNGGKAEVKNEMVVVEVGKQKAVSFTIEAAQPMGGTMGAAAPGRILVADQNVWVPGILVNSLNDEVKTSDFLYAFEAGDEVVLDITMSNLKGTNSLRVSTYPGGVVVYSNLAFQALTDQRFKMQDRGILKFTLSTNHMIDRNAFVKVWRMPAGPSTANFNTNVVWKKNYTTVQLVEPQEFYVNSGSNATFYGGKSRVSVPVKLPPNTVEWYYRFSASRVEADVKRVQASMSLLADLGGLLVTGGSSSLMGQGAQGLLGGLAKPPGANVCDIYLVTHENNSLFLDKTTYNYIPAASRENFKGGNVRVDCCPTGQWYLGIRNPDSQHGIHVFMDVAAIVMHEGWTMEAE
jgi:hypothetical protein